MAFSRRADPSFSARLPRPRCRVPVIDRRRYSTDSSSCDNSIARTGGDSKPTISEAEFGLGICDSAYRPQTWSGMGKLFQQETLSDVMLMAEGQSIPCHKFLLAAASDYFYNRLTVETETDNHNLLEIEGIGFNTLKMIVSYLYTGNINITAENAKDVIPACKILKLTSACDICEMFAVEKINPGNCIGLYKMATAYDFQHLSAKALHVMENNFNDVVSKSEFLTMSETDLTTYIQNENLKIPNEDPVFEAVKSWVRQEPQERGSSFTRLITHVRLRYCSSYYLTQIVSKEPLMDNRECQKILVAALVHHTTTALPDSSKQPGTGPRKGYTETDTLITIGGISDPGPVVRTDCWSLEEAGWRVMEQCPMPFELQFFSACGVKEGILVSGGYNGVAVVNQCWLLSTSSYQWSSLPNLNSGRARHASVSVGGQVYVIAGKGSNEENISSVECLPRFSAKWESVSDMPKALRHIMAVSYGESIYVFGGRVGDFDNTQSVFVYGTNSKLWQTLADMPHICSLGSAVVWKDKIYIVGGFDQSCMCYDPVLSQWSTLTGCTHDHADAPAVVWKDRILVCGGRSCEAKRDDGTAGCTSVIEEYDPETDTWTVSQIELPHKLCSHFMFSTENDYVTQGHPVAGDKTDIPQIKQAFLIGDATIDRVHGVKTSDGRAVNIHVRPEATLIEISEELDRDEIAKGVGELFLVCGSGDVRRERSVVEIRANLASLVSKAKDLCDSLKVSSILPSAKPNERINQLNDVMRDVCGQLGATFVDNDKNSFLRHNTRDETAFRGNTNRLTGKGILRLMENMGLAIPRLHKTIKR